MDMIHSVAMYTWPVYSLPESGTMLFDLNMQSWAGLDATVFYSEVSKIAMNEEKDKLEALSVVNKR